MKMLTIHLGLAYLNPLKHTLYSILPKIITTKLFIDIYFKDGLMSVISFNYL